jgi:hypothetical protein
MSDDEDRNRYREFSDLRWEIHRLEIAKAALEERISQAPPEATARLREQLGSCEKDLLLASQRFAYLEKLESSRSPEGGEEFKIELKRKKPKPTM